ncbi:MAG: dihydroorotase [Caulobacteraceae bacterium]
MRLLLKSCTIVNSTCDYEGTRDIYIEDGIITEISDKITRTAEQVIDAKGYKVLPGFIDMHAHLREPGFERKETVKTGSMAAARGGYTTICCMPNTKPPTDDEASLAVLMRIIERDAAVNVLPVAAVSKGQKSIELTEMGKLRKGGAIAFSDDGKPVMSAALMRQALIASRESGFLVIDHCEELSLAEGGVINEGKRSQLLGLKGIHSLSEELNIMRDVMIAEETGARIHIAHISTRKSVEIIRGAKSMGVKVTCEATPHHIGLTEDIIAEGHTECKVNPPLRTEADAAALKKALADGTVDAIATDHAPHHEDEKGSDFYSAAFGISGIETAFSVCFTELVQKGYITLKELTRKMSYNPAKILGIGKGEIKPGAPADLAIVDTGRIITVDRDKMVSKGKNTPFHGRTYTGDVIYTIADGKVVYENNNGR